MLEIKTINVNGKDFECYEIDGHPLKDLIILRQDLSLIDESRLSLAASGEVKGRYKNKILWEGQYVEVSGTYLNLLQAMLLDVGKWGTEYFSKLFKSLNPARTTIEKYDISSHLIATVHELKHGDHNEEEDSGITEDEIGFGLSLDEEGKLQVGTTVDGVPTLDTSKGIKFGGKLELTDEAVSFTSDKFSLTTDDGKEKLHLSGDGNLILNVNYEKGENETDVEQGNKPVTVQYFTDTVGDIANNIDDVSGDGDLKLTWSADKLVKEFTDRDEHLSLLDESKVNKEVGMGLSETSFTQGEKDKLNGIEAEATKNALDSFLLDRGNHTNTQPQNTVEGLVERLNAIEESITSLGVGSEEIAGELLSLRQDVIRNTSDISTLTDAV